MSSNEITLICNDDGVAIIGPTTEVESFLSSRNLESTELRRDRLGTALRLGSGAIHAASQLAETGRWMKLTKESAEKLRLGTLMTKRDTGNRLAILKTAKGEIQGHLQFTKGLKTLASNPAVLSAIAGVMAQAAAEQAVAEITDYLAKIDAKVDDILRAQKDAVLADMIGIDLVIEEALTLREQVGRVSEVTWSKVQAASTIIARTQAYALRQLDALADKAGAQTKMSELTRKSQEAAAKVPEWLAVLAHCLKLQDLAVVLELDRVLEISPEELDQHRLGLRTARQHRLELIVKSTRSLVTRMSLAAQSANSRVLLHPLASRDVVNSSNQVAASVLELHNRLGFNAEGESLEARAWTDAVSEVTDKVLSTGSEGITAAKLFGNQVLDRTLELGSWASRSLTERLNKTHRSPEEASGCPALEAVAADEPDTASGWSPA